MVMGRWNSLTCCRAVSVVQAQESVCGGDSSMGLCKGSGEAGVCVWAGGESSRSSADGRRQHVPHLPGAQQQPCNAFFGKEQVIACSAELAASGLPTC